MILEKEEIRSVDIKKIIGEFENVVKRCLIEHDNKVTASHKLRTIYQVAKFLKEIIPLSKNL